MGSSFSTCCGVIQKPKGDRDRLHEEAGVQGVQLAPNNLNETVVTERETESSLEGETPGVSFFNKSQGIAIKNARMNAYTTHNHASTHGSGLDTLHGNSAPSAEFDSKARSFDTPRCDKDTRVGLIEEIVEWTRNQAHPSKFLCLTGSAGSGKSALAQTIAEACAGESYLLASFFFFASDGTRNNSDRFVASLASQVARSLKFAKPFIVRAVEDNPSIFDKSLDAQIQSLLINPMKEAIRRSPSKESLSKWIIVIDGLDECKEERQQAQVLRILHQCTMALPFRVFLTSRPEYTIRSALSAPTGYLNGAAYHIVLNDHDATKDIQLYLERRLREIGRENNDDSWPLPDIIALLVEYASGQFVYAATVVKFVGERRRSPFQRLDMILDYASRKPDRGRNPFAMLDNLYSGILTTAQAAYKDAFRDGDEDDESNELDYIRRVSCLWRISGPNWTWVTSAGVEAYMQWDAGELRRLIEDLHSVVKPVDDPSLIHRSFKPYHKSFEDYLETSGRSQKFYVPQWMTYADIATNALYHIRLATADACSKCLHTEQYPVLVVSMIFLAWIFNRLFKMPGFSIDQAPKLRDALHQFAASDSWDKIVKAIRRNREGRGGRILDFWNTCFKDQILAALPKQDRAKTKAFFAWVEGQ